MFDKMINIYNKENDELYKFYNKISYNQDASTDKYANSAIKYLKTRSLGKKDEKKDFYLGIDNYIDSAVLRKNLEFFYRDSNKALFHTNLICDSLRLLNEYFSNFEGLDHLLINNYCDIEYNMYTFRNHKNAEQSFYREHFIHQFRNARLGTILIESFDEIKNGIKSIINSNNCFFANYINQSLSNNESIDNKFAVAYKAFFLACIYHDIGYPISHAIKVHQKTTEYQPFYKIVKSDIKIPFADIKAVLAHSVLFKLMKTSNIRKKYDKNDHGLYSAIAFLMNFYADGKIYSMDNDERCIVELAALSIYNHTDKYVKPNRIIFAENPISYLLRLCDDLQEYDRAKIHVDQGANFLACSKSNCFGLLMPIVDESDKYQCTHCTNTFNKLTTIKYTKNKHVNYLVSSDIARYNNKLIYSLNYCCMAQLELLYYDFYPNRHRYNELYELNSFFIIQKYIPDFVIKNNLSNNIYFISNQIIRKYITSKDYSEIKSLYNDLEDMHIRKKARLEIEDKEKAFNRKIYYVSKKVFKTRAEKIPKVNQLIIDLLKELVENDSVLDVQQFDDELKYKAKSREFIKKYYVILNKANVLHNK